ncbi:MAG: GNAT family N-acetyltransferase [Alphaproteobacteria bacterium]|nr:GNAT family N-acetyltransferase [Alphaproteobacteria bacterium]
MALPIDVQEIDRADPRAIEKVLAFWHFLYRDDPCWVPPLAEVLTRRLDPGHPFFHDATLHLYVARRGDELVGTISSLRDLRHERHKGEKVAFFGFFECIDEPAVAEALVERVRADARAWGAEVLRGPRNLSRVEEVGITVEGHDIPPPLLASHHPRSYQRLVEALGFEKHHDVLAYHRMLVEPDGSPTPIPEKLRERAVGCDIPGLVVRRARYRSLDHDLSLAHEVFVDAFRDVPENTPMPRDQFVALGRVFVLFSSRHLMQLATVDGRAAGFCICVPELNEAVIRAHGKLLPLGWARLAEGLRHVRTVSFKLIGVMPEFRGRGLNARLILAAVEGAQAAGYERVEGSLIDERNGASRGTVEGLELSVYRRYRIYDGAV